jgi:hypothetical protein
MAISRNELELRIRILEARSKVLVMQQAPVATGTLMRSIKTEKNDTGGFRLYIDTQLAPHMKYTEKPWASERGKNPNEGWFKDAAGIIARAAAATLNSTLSKQ